MRSSVFVILCLWLSTSAQVHATSCHPVSNDIDLIIREYDTRIEIQGEEKAFVTTSISGVLLLNSEAAYLPYTSTYYDDFKKIKDIQITISDLQGKVLKRIKRKDFTDHALSGSGTIFSDNRMLYYLMHHFDPPFVFRVDIEEELSQLMAISSWMPIRRDHIELESATLTIVHDEQMDIAFQSQLITSYEEKKGSSTTHQWKVEKFAALPKLSSYDSPLFQVVPWVRWVPKRFKFGGESGGFSSWDQFGDWLFKIGQESGDIPEELKAEILAWTQGAASTEEKIKLVYQYLQSNFRYVSVQLGIGGWKPTNSDEVHKQRYGDCKALSNYTKSLLEIVGVPSYYAVIQSGDDQFNYVQPDFPSNSFNHAVVLVPLASDTVLLECTTQTLPPGFRSSFTDNRFALAVSDGTSKLVKTPGYSLENNVRIDSIRVKVEESGTAVLNSHSSFGGVTAGLIQLATQPQEDQRAWLSSHLNFGNFSIQSYEFDLVTIGEWDYQTTLSTSLMSDNFVSKEDNRLFIRSDIFNSLGEIDLPDAVYYSFNLLRPYQNIVHCIIHIPEGYHMEYLPQNVVLEEPFGSYRIDFKMNEKERQLQIDRKLVIKAGKYSASTFDRYKEFRKQIREIERDHIVVVK